MLYYIMLYYITLYYSTLRLLHEEQRGKEQVGRIYALPLAASRAL